MTKPFTSVAAMMLAEEGRLLIADPATTERELSEWPGVVTVGIFARNRASVCLLGTRAGVRTLSF